MFLSDICLLHDKLKETFHKDDAFGKLNAIIAPHMSVYNCQSRANLLSKLTNLGYSSVRYLSDLQVWNMAMVGVDRDYFIYVILCTGGDEYILLHYRNAKHWTSWITSFVNFGSTAYYFDKNLRETLDAVKQDIPYMQEVYRSFETETMSVNPNLGQIFRDFGKDLEGKNVDKQERNIIHTCLIYRALTYVKTNSFRHKVYYEVGEVLVTHNEK